MTTCQRTFLWMVEFTEFASSMLEKVSTHRCGIISQKGPHHKGSTAASLTLTGSMWLLLSNSTSSQLAGITANLGREPFAWAENGLRGVCRRPGYVSRVEL
jgi:hypothetical protein